MEHIPKVVIKTVDGGNQRYPTVGDWLYDAEDDVLEIRISRMADYRSELAVALHEFYEAVQCLHHDISEMDVTKFDLKFEDERDAGKHGENDEPGDDKRAPYREHHIAATFVEQETCSRSGLDWSKHEQNVYDA